jgi:hypothetical protein
MYSTPITVLDRPWGGSRRLRLLDFKTIGTWRWPYVPATFTPSQGHNAAWRMMSKKNSSVTIGNRTRDLPSCSEVPQPTAPPRQKRWWWRNSMHYAGIVGNDWGESRNTSLGIVGFTTEVRTWYPRIQVRSAKTPEATRSVFVKLD